MESNLAKLQEELGAFGQNNSKKSASQTRRRLSAVNETNIVRSVFSEDKEHCHVITHLYVMY